MCLTKPKTLYFYRNDLHGKLLATVKGLFLYMQDFSYEMRLPLETLLLLQLQDTKFYLTNISADDILIQDISYDDILMICLYTIKN